LLAKLTEYQHYAQLHTA